MLKKLAKLAQDRYLLAAFLIFLSGLFLRFYRLNGFVTFLGDQGRDAIIIKQIVTGEHYPAIGPPTSVGQVYLGPFYYYFIAPWLWLFRFEPIGLAVGVAVFSTLYILINYFVVKDLFNKRVALLSSFLIAFSIVLIDLSRFSWNPNLLPLFTLLTVYFFIKAFQKLDWRLFALAGAFLSFSIQLHYLGLFLIPAVVIFTLIQLFEQKKYLMKLIIGGVVSLLSFFIFSSPLLVFDLRHNWLNTRNFLNLFKASGAISSNKLTNFFNSFVALNKFSFNSDFSFILSTLILFLFVLSFLFILRKKNNLRSLLLFFLLTVFGVSLYLTFNYPHYFAIIYPLYYVLLAYFLSLFSSFLGKILVGLFLLVFVVLNYQSYYFLTNPPNNQIELAKNISRIIYDNQSKKLFRLTALPQQYNDYTYRYFLDLWGKPAIDKGGLERTSNLFVVCDEKCKPIGDPQWDIAYFAPRKIDKMWTIDGLKIYKLSR